MPNIYSPSDSRDESANSAADLIRQKLAQVYADEPNAREELEEAQAASGHRSRHQQFMFELGNSGKSLAEIQTAWHNYYVNLPDQEKHRVWQEFYEEHNRRRSSTPQTPVSPSQPTPITPAPVAKPKTKKRRLTDTRNAGDIKDQLIQRVSSRSQVKRGGHLKSLLFGLSAGGLVVLILLFSFFNERFIAPFISPSKNVSSSSIIIDPSTTAVGSEPKLIIPKINVEIPVVYDEPSIAEDAIQSALERGAVHYATTSSPGELGNGAIFGHSSNNILNRGKYKFAFVLLNRLEPGDTFIVQKDGKRYVYQIFDKKIVTPNEVDIVNETGGKRATFSLITCDPPGTTINRLVVTGEQITPDPANNVASTARQIEQQAEILPGNSESLWHRLTSWLSS